MTAAVPEPIPAFVTAGLAKLDSEGVVHYGSEADLRDALAMRWWLAGAPSVRTEVKVPDCGRIDILVGFAQRMYVIEVKQRIVTPTQARQAFQQAHAYQSYLGSRGDLVTACVIAAQWDVAAADSALQAYPSVGAQHFDRAVATPGQVPHHLRMETAERRSLALSRLAEMSRAAYLNSAWAVEDVRLSDLTPDHQETS